jgi:hypothetical protein
MAAATRALTPSQTGPFSSTIAPDTPTSITSQSKSLAPTLAAAAIRASASPRSQKSALSPRYSPQPFGGASAEQQRARQPSPNPAAAVLKNFLGQGQTGATGPATQLSEPVALMAQKIEIPEAGANDNLQSSPVSISSIASVEHTTVPATSAPTLAVAMPQQTDNAFSEEDPNTSRPAVDSGVAGAQDSRAFTFPPPPADDPRNPHRNMSLPNAGYGNSSPKSQKRHKCPYCSTVFTRHHNLKSHLLTHSQEKPYECQQCQSRFRRLHDLKRHTKLHTGERPHECPKCGRKFARGDALARHNKGQGGCAGRRSDFGLDDDGDGRVDDSMDGVEYTAEPEHMDEDGVDGERRGSEASRAGRQDSGPYRGGPSTYPPIGPRMGNNVAQMYPPAGSAAHNNSSPGPHPPHLPHFSAAQRPMFGQPGVTESPKPISPGQTDSQRTSGSRGFQSQYPTGSGRGSTSQLPPLPGTFGSMPPPGVGSHPGSMSSHSGGSGASGRETYGSTTDEAWWKYIRDIEGSNQQMRDELAHQNQLEHERQTRIVQLEKDNKELKDEIAALKAQLANQVKT